MENTVYTSIEKRLNRGNLDADSAKFTPMLGLTTDPPGGSFHALRYIPIFVIR